MDDFNGMRYFIIAEAAAGVAFIFYFGFVLLEAAVGVGDRVVFSAEAAGHIACIAM